MTPSRVPSFWPTASRDVWLACHELALIFAPHGNSYERLVPGQHAPTAICWAYDNRTASVRVPGGSFKARRIEHRVAGGDVNPYLFLAAVLGSALVGIEDKLVPPAPIEGQPITSATATANHLGRRD